MPRHFFRSLILLVGLNLLVKPVWIFAIDRQVQNITGFSSYGHYFALLNLCIILNFLLDLGITSFFNREVASGNGHEGALFTQALSGKLILSFIYAGMVFFIGVASGIDDYSLLLMLIIMQVGSSFLLFLRSYLTATQHYRTDAVISVMDKLFVVIVVGSMIIYPMTVGHITIQNFVLIQVAGIILSSAVALMFLVKNIPGFSFQPFRGLKKEIFFSSLPIALNIFFVTLMTRADGFLLESIINDDAREAGIYAAGFRLLDAFNMVGFLMAGFLLPFMARHWPNQNRFFAVLLTCRHLLVIGSMIVVAFAFAAPEYLSNLLYHNKDPYISNVIMIVLFALPGLSMIHIYGTALTATRNMRIYLVLSIIFSLLSVILNLIFIPRYGAMASAVIACSIQTLYALSVIYFARMKTGIRLSLAFIPLYLVVGLSFYVIVKVANFFHWNLMLSAGIGALIIAILFFYRSGFSIAQLRKLLAEK
ncbi:oligosaccharide flippase family protein [Pollutibacter soli]|uniref:oligosaccharide flippase family protein n=1 Tax=Pollutibacter soli TaxID=3034157 RepID=UPI003013D737